MGGGGVAELFCGNGGRSEVGEQSTCGKTQRASTLGNHRWVRGGVGVGCVCVCVCVWGVWGGGLCVCGGCVGRGGGVDLI